MDIKKEYINFNKCVLLLGVLLILLPIIVYVVRLVIPWFLTCIHYDLTNEPCPFCGITTDLKNILLLRFSKVSNPLTIPILAIGTIEMVLRGVYIKKSGKIKSLSKIMIIDGFIHIVLIILLMIYVIKI